VTSESLRQLGDELRFLAATLEQVAAVTGWMLAALLLAAAHYLLTGGIAR
jgi:hypothetical protein